MYANIATIILENEKSDSRFENFVRSLFEKEEGITFVPTSQSWDMGRDARSIGRSKASHRSIICATLNSNLEPKVEADLLRLTSTSSPERLIYCSSQQLSEHAVDEITKIIRRHVPNGSITVVGALQIAALAKKYADIFEKYYHAETQEIRQTFLDEVTRDNNNGLRLALITFASAEGSSLRSDVLKATLLSLLDSKKPQTENQLIKLISDGLRMNRSLSENFLKHILSEEQIAGNVTHVVTGWILTDKGVKQQESLPVEAAANFIRGREAVRSQLSALMGQPLTATQFSQVWSGILDCIGSVFHENGLATVLAVNQILTPTSDGQSNEIPDLRLLLTEGIRRAVSPIQSNELREEVYRAILDLFTEREGPAFDWFTQVAERFVILCSLGLEDSAGSAIRDTVLSNRIVLDSDIILDVICEAETDHNAAKELLGSWVRLGGKILVAPVVLEEVAHHAWISEKDFLETESLLGKLRPFERKRYIRSAFVRSFHAIEKRAEKWFIYINQFKGNSSGDYTKILRLLKGKLKVDLLPDVYDDSLRESITKYLLSLSKAKERAAEQQEDMSFKAGRDGRLLASIAAARKAQDAIGTIAPIVLVSSARQLRLADVKFRAELGGDETVLAKSGLSLVLSTIPEASLGADSLRRALFDFGAHAHLTDIDRKALRLLRASEEYDLPWAERVTLHQTLSNSIKAEASKRGTSERLIKEEIIQGKDPESSARLIAESIKDLAIPGKTVKELEMSKSRVSELETKLAETEAALRLIKSQQEIFPKSEIHKRKASSKQTQSRLWKE